MADLSAMLARIVDIAGDIDGIALADDQYPDTLSGNVPFVFVMEGPASFSPLDNNRWDVAQEFIATLYVQAFAPEDQTQEKAARDTARPFLISYPAYFLARTRLQRNDQGLVDVTRATVVSHDGIRTASWKQVEYTGIAFRHTVHFEIFVDEV